VTQFRIVSRYSRSWHDKSISQTEVTVTKTN